MLTVSWRSGDASALYGTPTAWKENGVWYLFYERNDLGVWLATSKDMKVWTNIQDEPVMTPGPGEYDKATDLIHWEKYAGNPLQAMEQNKSSGIVVHDGEKFRLYTMHSQVHVHVNRP